MQAAFARIQEPQQLGDVILMLDEAGGIIHACVYIAGPLVFTRDGGDRFIPFRFAYLKDVEALYRFYGVTDFLYLRKKFDGPTQYLQKHPE